MAERERITDFYGKTIAFIEHKDNGDKVVTDFYGKILGKYDSYRDVTCDFYGKVLAHGDACGMLISMAGN
ncbi:MAG: hypothetical protein KBS44_06270 [Clostridiales bacterium]|nr:hypothetical protein [Candidatus Coliplasma equi]